MKHQLDATLCRFYFCRVNLHVSSASAYYQEYLNLVQRPLVHVLSLQVSHHISLLGPELKAYTMMHGSTNLEFWYVKYVPKYLNSIRPFKRTIISLYAVTSSCILISRHGHVLSFIKIYLLSNLLTSHYQSFCPFLYIMYATFQYINANSIKLKLMCTI
jgi:hypothetical protein